MDIFERELIFNVLREFVEQKYNSIVTLKFSITDKDMINNDKEIPIIYNIVFTEDKPDTYSEGAKKNFFYIGFMLKELLMTYQCFGIDDTLRSMEYSIDSILNEHHHDIDVYKR